MNGPGAPNSAYASHEDSTYKTALKGASLAFQKNTPQPKPIPATSNRLLDNGALIAATSASRDHSLSSSPSQATSSKLPISRQTTGNSVQAGNYAHEIENGAASQRLGQYTPTSQQGLLMPVAKQTMADTRSPSFIAATLAASRSGSPSPNPVAQPHPYAQQAARRQRKGSLGGQSAASSVTSLDLATDSSPIPPTNSLISMFEKGEDGNELVRRGTTVPKNNKSLGPKPKLRPLTPPRALSPIVKHDTSPPRPRLLARQRAASPPTSAKDMAQEKRQQEPAVQAKKRPPAPPPSRAKADVDVVATAPSLESRGKPRASTPPPRSISQADTVILSPQPKRTATQKILSDQTIEAQPVNTGRKAPAVKPKPQRPISIHGTSQPPASTHGMSHKSPASRPASSSSSNSSNDTFVSASAAPSPEPDSPRRGRSRPPNPDLPRRLARPASAQSVSVPPQKRPIHPQPRQTATNIPLDSLTSAIVAGSLASSRMTPAPTAPPTPPPRKQTPHMRQTLRKPPTKPDDEESRARSKHRKPLGKLGGKKKHSHHEGSRKRWREEITLRERKRYEGLWASNRGLLLTPPSTTTANYAPPGASAAPEDEADQLVANVVVRDIWARSRLPFDELAEVWDLVDTRGRGVLDRVAFVVGMWLVDQRLRGRKIPQKVGESVWSSAKGMVLGPAGGKKR